MLWRKTKDAEETGDNVWIHVRTDLPEPDTLVDPLAEHGRALFGRALPGVVALAPQHAKLGIIPQQPGEQRFGTVLPEGKAERLTQPSQGRRLWQDRGGEFVENSGERSLDHFPKQGLLVVELQIECALRAPGFGRHVVEPCAGEAAFGEVSLGDIEDALPSSRIAPGQSRRHGGRRR